MISFNTQKVMAQIKEKEEETILHSGPYQFDAGVFSADDLKSEGSIDDHLYACRLTGMLDFYAPIEGNKAFVFVKRCVRKLSTFLILPMVDSQNIFNNNIERTCEELFMLALRQQKQIDNLESQIASLGEPVREEKNG